VSGYALHPEAYDDIDEIRAYIAEDNPDAADRMVNEIFDRIRQLPQFPDQGFRRPTLLRPHCALSLSVSTLSRMFRRKSRCGLSACFMAAAVRA
jgi:plasmid stabilization system protein ParE